MTIQNIKLSDKFHTWVAATNLMIDDINREIVLEAKQNLLTTDKSTLVAAINEIYNNSLSKNKDLYINNNVTVKSILSNTKIQVGSEGNENSVVEFYDDTTNLYRKFLFNKDDHKWYVENENGQMEELLTNKTTIDGDNQTLLIKGLTNDEFNNYIGPERSLSYNLVTKAVRVHDGFTVGGISLTTAGLVVDKVKVNENDVNEGYLNNKLKSGTGIQISEESTSGVYSLSIKNTHMEEFNNAVANTYVKRNSTNNSYQFLFPQDVINDLNVGKIYSNKRVFNDDIVLEDNIICYYTDINQDTVISFTTSNLSKINEAIEFELILKVTKANTDILFSNGLKWNNNEVVNFDQTGYYVIKIKTIDSGLNWFAKLDGLYSI